LKWIYDKFKKSMIYLFMKISRFWTIKAVYFFRFKKPLNLKKPKTFNEKLQYLKIFYFNASFRKYADKVEVRKLLQEKQLEYLLNEVYFVGRKIESRIWDLLPKKFVIKANHSSGDILIIKEKDQYKLKDVNKIISKWLKKDYSNLNGEIFYSKIDRRVLVEKYLEDDYGEIPKDYKFHCFNGKPKFIQVDIDRFGEHKRNFYDLEWNLQKFSILHPNDLEKVHEKPILLRKMIQVSETLSSGLPYCRIDLYFLSQKIVFGEITLVHGSGFEKITPKEYEIVLGNYIDVEASNETNKFI